MKGFVHGEDGAKTSMKKLFEKPNIKADGTPGKVRGGCLLAIRCDTHSCQEEPIGKCAISISVLSYRTKLQVCQRVPGNLADHACREALRGALRCGTT
jgi:hypothetical protein